MRERFEENAATCKHLDEVLKTVQALEGEIKKTGEEFDAEDFEDSLIDYVVGAADDSDELEFRDCMLAVATLAVAAMKAHDRVPVEDDEPEPPEYEIYEHHGREVAVDADLRGDHRMFCLCYNCRKFHPEDRELNCPIANAVYLNCLKFGIVSPVWECPPEMFEPIEGEIAYADDEDCGIEFVLEVLEGA